MESTRSTLPHSMRYTLGRIPSVSASTTQRTFAAQNGNIFDHISNEIIIPVTSSDGFLDTSRSYLAFELNGITRTIKAATLASDAVGCIDSIRIESQGVLLERLERYNVHHNLTSRLSGNTSEQGQRNVLAGGPVPAVPQATTGHPFTLADAGGGVTKLDCAVSLSGSAFLNSHDSMALPMGTQFNIIIRVADIAHQATWAEAGELNGFAINNARFICPIYRIENPGALSAYKQFQTTSGASWSGTTFKTYISALTNVAGEQVCQINDRSLSLLSLAAVCRLPGDLIQAGTKTAFAPNGCTSYHFEVNGQSYPQNRVQVSDAVNTINMARVYAEMKNSKLVKEPSVALASMLTNSYVMCADMKVFDDDQLALRGFNTAQSASPNLLRFTGATATAVSEIVIFATCEAYYTLAPDGRLSVVV